MPGDAYVHYSLLLLVSAVSTGLGFIVCYLTFDHLDRTRAALRMRICMVNGMALAFVFAMFIELTTSSKVLAVLLPIISVCIPVMWAPKFATLVELAELAAASLMSVAMSVMLIGMVQESVIIALQVCLFVIELALYVAARRVTHDDRLAA